MIKYSDFKKEYIKTVKIVHEESGLEMVVREPTISEMKNYENLPEAERQDMIQKLFPSCVITHNIQEDNGELIPASELCATLEESMTGYADILKTWLDGVTKKKATSEN